MDVLTAEGLSISFGGLKAVQDVSFAVPKGTIVSIIGPNGAGKTTIFNMLTGFYVPDHGTIKLEGEELAGRRAHEFIGKGLARTFQNIRIFPGLTVLENVLIGCQCRLDYGFWHSLLATPTRKRIEAQAIAKARRVLESIKLLDSADTLSAILPYGRQKRLEIARALMSDPKLLLLDEPAAGLNPQETYELSRYIKGLTGQGYSVLLIEHDIRLVMGISDYVHVLDHGIKIAEGTPSQVQQNEDVITAYLGRGGLRRNAPGNKRP